MTSPCPNSVEAMIGICLTQEKHRCFQLLKDVEGNTCFPYFDGVETTNYRFTSRLLKVGHRFNYIKFEFEGYVSGFICKFDFFGGFILVDVLSAGWSVAVALSEDFWMKTESH